MTAETFNGALRKVAGNYRRALPRAVERGTIFALGVTVALQAVAPVEWVIVPFAFLVFAVQASVVALLVGARATA